MGLSHALLPIQMPRFGYLWPPAAVLVAGAAVTLALSWQLQQTADSRDRDRFDMAAAAIQEHIVQRLATAKGLLRGGAGMFAVARVDRPADFRAFVDRLGLESAASGVRGMGFVQRVAVDEVPAFEARERLLGRRHSVWPAGRRPEYFPITYLEPANDANRRALGFDMFSEPTRRAAMERARDTGEPAASGAVQLVQAADAAAQPGFLIYVPVYAGSALPATIEERRVRLHGFVYSAFSARDFFASLLSSNPQSRAGLELFDGTAPAAVRMYRSPLEDTGRFARTTSLEVGGRPWTARAFSTPGLEASSVAGYIPLVRWLGGTVTSILVVLAFLQRAARARAAESEFEAADAAQRFETLANVIPQLAWMARADGWIYWYNERWYEYTGTTPKDMEGWGWHSVHDPEVLPAVLEQWRHSIASGQPFDMEFPLRAADGKFRLFLTRVIPLRDREGRVTHWFGTNTDVQYKRDAEHSLQEHARTLATLNATGVQIARELDLERLLQAVTDAGTQLTRASMGAFFYNTVNERNETFTLLTLSGVDRAAFRDFPMPRNTALFGPTFRGEPALRSDDITMDSRFGRNEPYHGMPAGHPPVRSYMAVPVKSRSGEVLGGLFFGHPDRGVFTEQAEHLASGIAAQAAVAIDNAQLYRRVQQLLTSERAAREEAERISRLKDEFLATLSHELRTPLNAVLGWARMLESGAVSAEKERTALEMILRNALAQSTLIEDLLDMSRIVAGQVNMAMEIVDAAEIAHAALNTVRPAASAKQIEILAHADRCEHWVNADATRLQQVFWNLLTNAVKFTPAGGRIALDVRCPPGSVEVSVTDTGIGIDDAFLPHVFERFRQADASLTRRHGGLGLGLSIVKNLVEMHGGTIEAHSDGAGTGARFVVRLPAVARRGEPLAVSPPPVDAGAPPQV